MKRVQTLFLPVVCCVILSLWSTDSGLGSQAERSPWKRVSTEPILAPSGNSWEAAGTFNPAVIRQGKKIVMLYRAQDANGTSRLGYASSDDGVHFTRRAEPVLSPEAPYEENGGVEDPRLVKIGKTFYLTYTGYNKKDAHLCWAPSADLFTWKPKGIFLPTYQGNWNAGWTKSGAILSQKIHGKYWMYWLGTSPDKKDEMGLSYSGDLIHWTEATKTPVLGRRPGQFDERVVEPGPPPLLTKGRHSAHLQRRRRALGLPDWNRDLRPQRPAQASVAQRTTGFLARATLGKNRSGPQCGLCRGMDRGAEEVSALLWRRRQVRRSCGSESAAVMRKPNAVPPFRLRALRKALRGHDGGSGITSA